MYNMIANNINRIDSIDNKHTYYYCYYYVIIIIIILLCYYEYDDDDDDYYYYYYYCYYYDALLSLLSVIHITLILCYDIMCKWRLRMPRGRRPSRAGGCAGGAPTGRGGTLL